MFSCDWNETLSKWGRPTAVQVSATILLKECSNKVTPNDILLPIDQCPVQTLSEKLLPAGYGNKYRDPQLECRDLEHSLLNGMSSSNPSPQDSVNWRGWRKEPEGMEDTRQTVFFNTEQDWHTQELRDYGSMHRCRQMGCPEGKQTWALSLRILAKEN